MAANSKKNWTGTPGKYGGDMVNYLNKLAK
jgi:hypothetical protein